MASITWRYEFRTNLAPGQSEGVYWGPSDELKGATFTITAHPATNRRNTNFWLTVSEVSIGTRDIGTGDIGNVQTTLWARVQNNGNVGDGTVQGYVAYVTRNTP